MKKNKILFWIFFTISVLINVFIIFQSCLPATSSMVWSNVFVNVIQSMSRSGGGSSVEYIGNMGVSDFVRKTIGHFSLFFVSGVFSFFAFYFYFKIRKSRFTKFLPLFTLFLGIFVAGLSEFIQFLIPTRAGLFSDVAIDLLGYVVGGGIPYLITFLYVRHQQKKSLQK